MGVTLRIYLAVFLGLTLGCSSIRVGHEPLFERELCPQWAAFKDGRSRLSYILRGRELPDFSNNEKRLICGEEKFNPEHPNEGWIDLPFAQGKYNLKNFLQERGYHFPNFNLVDNKTVNVEVGELTRVKAISLEGNLNDPNVHLNQKRDIIGQILTPKLLDTVEKWVMERLQNFGYPCPQVSVVANPATGEIKVKIAAGRPMNFTPILQEEVEGLNPNVLRRFDAFHLGRPYDESLLTVTANRIRADGIVESSYFTQKCESEKVLLRQVVVPGAPRLLTAGAGVNTEGVLLGTISWRNTRLDSAGTLLDISANASARIQKLAGKLNWYLFPSESRLYLYPSIQLLHRDEIPFEFASSQAQIGIATSSDSRGLGVAVFLGPTFDYYRTFRGIGAPTTNLLSLEGRVILKSHDYEFYSGTPQSGFYSVLTADVNEKFLFSDVTAQRFYIRGEKLWNLGGFDPPLWILGLRGGYTTIVTNETTGPGTPLPASFFQYLGGSLDLRGFGRQELPFDQSTANICSGFLGFEGRLSHTLPWGLDPFVFVDFGALGTEPIIFDSALFWSPGIGVRWASPIGPIRTTIAHGFVDGTPAHLQFYFSFGEEF